MSTQHPITIYLGPGETITQALIRAGVMSPPKYGPIEALTIPPGVKIIGPASGRRASLSAGHLASHSLTLEISYERTAPR